MRFFTFLKEYFNEVGMDNEEVITFAGWIFSSGYPKKNPHAGLPQIKLALLSIKHSKVVWFGFVKTCLAFHERHPEELPIHLQQRADLLEFLELTDADLERHSKPSV